MSVDLIERLDRILENSGCRLSIEDIGSLMFGAFPTRSALEHNLDDIIEAGHALRKLEAFPLALPVPRESGFFLISWAAEKRQDWHIMDGAMGIDKITRRMEKIERRHGRGDLNPWPVAEAPPAWQAANREWERIADEIFLAVLLPLAPDMSELFATDPKEYDRRREHGRQGFVRILGRDDRLLGLEGEGLENAGPDH